MLELNEKQGEMENENKGADQSKSLKYYWGIGWIAWGLIWCWIMLSIQTLWDQEAMVRLKITDMYYFKVLDFASIDLSRCVKCRVYVQGWSRYRELKAGFLPVNLLQAESNVFVLSQLITVSDI